MTISGTGTQFVGGVSVPSSPLITEAIEYARRLSEPYLFNHAMRSWLFATRIGQVRGLHCDHEVVAVGTILHDIGLATGVSGSNRLEVNGGNAAVDFIRERGLADGRRFRHERVDIRFDCGASSIFDS